MTICILKDQDHERDVSLKVSLGGWRFVWSLRKHFRVRGPNLLRAVLELSVYCAFLLNHVAIGMCSVMRMI